MKAGGLKRVWRPIGLGRILRGEQSYFPERIAVLYRFSPMVRLAHVAMASLAAILCAPVAGPWPGLALVIAIGLLTLGRQRAVAAYSRDESRLSPLAWAWLRAGFGFASGLAWSLYGFTVLGLASPWYDLILLILILGTGLSNIGYGVWLPASAAFPLAVLVPVSLLYWSQEGPLPRLVGTLLLLILVVFVFVAARIGDAILSSVRLAKRNLTLNKTLVIERDRAEAANRAKANFLATMGHELKTPLNAIIGFAEIMALEREQALPPLYRDYVQDIIVSGRHLLDVMNDILAMSRIEAGRFTLSPEPADLSEIAVLVIRLMTPEAERQGVALRLDAPASIEAMVDVKAMRQVLLNLVSNAIKFSSSGGGVRLGLRAQAETIAIEVEDQGIGIAARDLDRVLMPFEQADDPLVRRHEGAGLGLPISVALVELHGGRLTLESAIGEGTRVHVSLPRAAPVPVATRDLDDAPEPERAA